MLLVIVTTSLYGLLEAPTGWRQLSCSKPFERVHPRLRGIPWKQSISIFTGARILRVKNYISDKVTGNSELIPLKLNTLQAPVKIVLLSCYLTYQFFLLGNAKKITCGRKLVEVTQKSLFWHPSNTHAFKHQHQLSTLSPSISHSAPQANCKFSYNKFLYEFVVTLIINCYRCEHGPNMGLKYITVICNKLKL